MFDTIVNPSSGVPRQRWTTTALSALGHVAIMIALIVSTIYATDVLPTPRDVITFVTVAPPPPPPPPPVVRAPEAPARKSVAVKKPVLAQPAPPAARTPIAAPVAAPETIAPETGLEGGEFEPVPAAGFEKGIPGGIAGGITGGLDTALPPPPPPAEPVRVGGAIAAPRLIHRVEPEYPDIAARAQIEGVVILEARVDETGVVRDARVLRSHELLDAAAVRAVEQWRYEPLMFNGKPTPFVLTVTVSFGLGRDGRAR